MIKINYNKMDFVKVEERSSSTNDKREKKKTKWIKILCVRVGGRTHDNNEFIFVCIKSTHFVSFL